MWVGRWIFLLGRLNFRAYVSFRDCKIFAQHSKTTQRWQRCAAKDRRNWNLRPSAMSWVMENSECCSVEPNCFDIKCTKMWASAPANLQLIRRDEEFVWINLSLVFCFGNQIRHVHRVQQNLMRLTCFLLEYKLSLLQGVLSRKLGDLHINRWTIRFFGRDKTCPRPWQLEDLGSLFTNCSCDWFLGNYIVYISDQLMVWIGTLGSWDFPMKPMKSCWVIRHAIYMIYTFIWLYSTQKDLCPSKCHFIE